MQTIYDLDTPSLIVDLDVMEDNLARMQHYCDSHGIGLRPHIKTHKIPELAQKQLELGAVGIACQKLGEAETSGFELGVNATVIQSDAFGWDVTFNASLLDSELNELGLEGMMRRVAVAANFRHATWGPDELFYGELYSSRKVDCPPTLARPATRDAYSACVSRDLVERARAEVSSSVVSSSAAPSI